jgi:hypothetical protein
MNTTDKIFHHFAFTFFWSLVVLVIITTGMRIIQWDTQSIKTCMDKGYSEIQCKGL